MLGGVEKGSVSLDMVGGIPAQVICVVDRVKVQSCRFERSAASSPGNIFSCAEYFSDRWSVNLGMYLIWFNTRVFNLRSVG